MFNEKYGLKLGEFNTTTETERVKQIDKFWSVAQYLMSAVVFKIYDVDYDTKKNIKKKNHDLLCSFCMPQVRKKEKKIS